MRNDLRNIRVVSAMSRKRCCVVFSSVLLFALATLRLLAQTASTAPATPLRFEVATIRPHKFAGDEPSDRRMLPGGRFVATATTVRTLLRIAFGAAASGISGVPGWVDTDLFDINGSTVDHGEVKTPEQFQELILSLLEERFQLKFHMDEKTTAVYWLELDKAGKTGPGLRPSGADAQPNMSNSSNGSRATMKVSKASMNDVAAALTRQAGRPVEDHTDLKGDFDFEIAWTPDGAVEPAEPPLVTVLKEQLGLKLQSAKGATKVVVVDQIAHPSVN